MPAVPSRRIRPGSLTMENAPTPRRRTLARRPSRLGVARRRSRRKPPPAPPPAVTGRGVRGARRAPRRPAASLRRRRPRRRPPPAALRLARRPPTTRRPSRSRIDVFRATFSNRGAVLTSFVLKRSTRTSRAGRSSSSARCRRACPGRSPWSSRKRRREEEGRSRRSSRSSGSRSGPAPALGRTATVRDQGNLGRHGLPVRRPRVRRGPGLLRSARPRSAQSRRARAGLALRDAGFRRRRRRRADWSSMSPREGEGGEAWPLPAKGFAGIEDNYFLEALVPHAPSEARRLHVRRAASGREARAGAGDGGDG